MKHFGVRRALLAATVLSMWVLPAFAQTHTTANYPARETQIKRLGTRQRFSMPMHTTDELRTMVNRNRGPFNQALSIAGLSGISGQVMDTLSSGAVTETTIQPGTHMEWMAMKRGGVPTITQNIRWSGPQPFEAWQFTITDGGYTYTFLMPKICGNLTLLSAVSIPPATVSEARPEPPAPPPPRLPPPPPPPAPVAAAPPPPPPAYAPVTSDRSWMASGFLGTNFGSSRNNDNAELFGLESFDSSTTSATFGGQVAYLARGVIGGEFLAEFSPRSGNFNNILFDRSPNVNTYMFNAIAVAPFGQVHSFDPYISGGIGWVGMHADIFTIDPSLVPDISTISTESVSAHRFGWDLGGGVMAWTEKNWGFRGDVRYYRTTSGNNNDVFDINDIGNGDVFTRVELSGISFWKANAGLAFRW